MAAKRVLIIEDNPDAAEALAMLLRSAGHDVSIAHSGDDGLSLAHDFRPDLVLCDLRLHGARDGLAVARELRSDSTLGAIALIALTGVAEPDEQAKAIEAGFDQLIVKPADPDRILKAVSTANRRE